MDALPFFPTSPTVDDIDDTSQSVTRSASSSSRRSSSSSSSRSSFSPSSPRPSADYRRLHGRRLVKPHLSSHERSPSPSSKPHRRRRCRHHHRSPPPAIKEYPLVLLHCTLLPPSLFLTTAINHHHHQQQQPSETILRDVLPEPYWKRWRLLQDKVLSSETLRERGVLISHPQEAFDKLGERLLDSVGLVSLSDADADADADADHAHTGEKGEKWDMRVYAANGLMGAGAWAAAWKEMEKVDVEIMMHLPLDIKGEIERRMEMEAERAKDGPASAPHGSVDGIPAASVTAPISCPPESRPVPMPIAKWPWTIFLGEIENSTLTILCGTALILGAVAISRPRIIGYLLRAVTMFEADVGNTNMHGDGISNEPPPCAMINHQAPPPACVFDRPSHIFSSRHQC